MPIDLGGGSVAPSIKCPAAGDYLTFSLVDMEVVPWTDYATGLPKISAKTGEPRTQDLMYCQVLDGDHCYIADETGNLPLVNNKGETVMHRRARKGELVRLYMSGHHRWEAIQAFKKLGRSPRVGDVCQWKISGFEPSSAGNDKKVSTFAARDPKDGEPTRQEMEALHLQRKAQASTAVVDVPVTAGTSARHDDDFGDSEEPF